jgi:Gram-negative bacterial TonB protein C-terminal
MMKFFGIILLLAFYTSLSFGQDSTNVEKPSDSLKVMPVDTNAVDSSQVEEVKPTQRFTLVTKAKYEGGDSAFARKVRENIAYPAEARQKKFKSKLIVQFIVDKDARVRDIKITEGFPEDAEAEFKTLIEGLVINAINVASETGWTAATNNEKQNVAMRKTIPIVFNPYKTKPD